MDETSVERFWQRFVDETGIDGPHDAWAFGADDDPDQQTELGRLVLEGPKRATASLVVDYENEGTPIPAVGDLSVILDGAGVPLCVIRTTEVEVKPFGEVDEAFAWDEGEGDRTLAWWRAAHERFFAREGHEIDDTTPFVLERFELLWPTPRVEDRGAAADTGRRYDAGARDRGSEDPMSEREPFPEEESEGADPAVPSSVPADVPEADALEQSAPVGGGEADDEPAAVGDRPEADALEQAAEVTEPDDDYRG